MKRKWFESRGRHGRDELERALEAWRASSTSTERLSDGTRARILDRVHRRAPIDERRPLSALFLPARRFALAAGLPLLALTLVLGYSLIPAGLGRPSADPSSTRLQVSKQGDEVVFMIANGRKTHTVSVSDKADAVPPGATYRVTDSFRDRLQSDSNLVFYRFE